MLYWIKINLKNALTFLIAVRVLKARLQKAVKETICLKNKNHHSMIIVLFHVYMKKKHLHQLRKDPINSVCLTAAFGAPY